MENLVSLLILAGTGYIVCLYPWEIFWYLLNGLTWLTWWIVKLSICASVLCVADLLLEEKWHQRFPKKSSDPV